MTDIACCVGCRKNLPATSIRVGTDLRLRSVRVLPLSGSLSSVGTPLGGGGSTGLRGGTPLASGSSRGAPLLGGASGDSGVKATGSTSTPGVVDDRLGLGLDGLLLLSLLLGLVGGVTVCGKGVLVSRLPRACVRKQCVGGSIWNIQK